MIYMISGPIASGKGEVTNVIRNIYGSCNVSVFVLSDLLRAEAKRRGLDVTRKNLKIIGDEWRKRMGHGALAKKIFPLVNQVVRRGKIAIVDSIRFSAEVDALKHTSLPNLFLFVGADEQMRAQRMRVRDRKDDRVIDVGQTLRQEWMNFELSDLKQMADLIINGSLPLVEIQRKIQSIIK